MGAGRRGDVVSDVIFIPEARGKKRRKRKDHCLAQRDLSGIPFAMLADDTSELLIPGDYFSQTLDCPLRQRPTPAREHQCGGHHRRRVTTNRTARTRKLPRTVFGGRTQGRMLLSHALRRSQSESFVSRVHEMIVFTRSHTAAHAHAGIYIFGT